jgi:NADH:ubiquinone oxidoreductase subunit 5 (subunit L)/multisubunit Na+/H+ antiporter MnhA subunit
MFGASALALVGALAALCFVRILGIVLLGSPRGSEAERARESPPMMTLPILALASACVVAALGAPALGSALLPLLEQFGVAGSSADALNTLSQLSVANGVLLPIVMLAASSIVWIGRGRATSDTWGCGYAAPTSRMQYGGRAFSEILTTRLLPRWLGPSLRMPRLRGTFPNGGSFVSESFDPLTKGAYEPFLMRCAERFARLRFLQQGNIHIYIVYIVGTAVVGLSWAAVGDWLAP